PQVEKRREQFFSNRREIEHAYELWRTKGDSRKHLFYRLRAPLRFYTAKTQTGLGSRRPSYSITSSARASSDAGRVKPNALAFCSLMNSSNLVGCSTGSSVGFASFRILSTKYAIR